MREVDRHGGIALVVTERGADASGRRAVEFYSTPSGEMLIAISTPHEDGSTTVHAMALLDQDDFVNALRAMLAMLG